MPDHDNGFGERPRAPSGAFLPRGVVEPGRQPAASPLQGDWILASNWRLGFGTTDGGLVCRARFHEDPEYPGLPAAMETQSLDVPYDVHESEVWPMDSDGRLTKSVQLVTAFVRYPGPMVRRSNADIWFGSDGDEDCLLARPGAFASLARRHGILLDEYLGTRYSDGWPAGLWAAWEIEFGTWNA